MAYLKRLFLVSLISLSTLPSIPQDAQAEPVKCTAKLAKTFVSLRRVCLNGVCDIARLLKDKPNFNVQALYHFLTTNTQHITFIFATNRAELDQAQWEESKNELELMMGVSSDSKNNAFFVIGSASRTGSIDDNRLLAARRMKAVVDKIKSDIEVECDNFFYTFTGAEGFQFTHNMTEKLHMITDASRKLIKREVRKGKRKDNVVNQNVMVLGIPCVPEMCKAAVAEWGQNKVCDADPTNEFHFKECVPFVCQKNSGQGSSGGSRFEE